MVRHMQLRLDNKSCEDIARATLEHTKNLKYLLKQLAWADVRTVISSPLPK